MRRTLTMRSWILGLALLSGSFAVASSSSAQVAVGVSVSFAPPEIPVYEQPVCPGEDYIWVPGYWDWDGEDYFWVPGTWILAPEPGFLWTPGYWAWRDGGFFFTAGYWGPVVGFYGGIDYGFGYFGHGFEGGRWEHDHFFYNRAVTNVNVTVIHNVYEARVDERNVTRVSYNGGRGGIEARPSRQEEAAARERHIGPVSAQTQHIQAARSDRTLRASANHGAPPVAATPRSGEFRGGGVVAARSSANFTRPADNAGRGGNAARPESNAARPEGNTSRSNPPIHPNELPPAERTNRPNTGNPKFDQKYQQQQDKLATQQARERQNLQTRQEQEHQRAQQRQAPEPSRQQMEQRHQQQTQQLQQRHEQQTQRLQSRQQPPAEKTQKKR